MAKKRIYKTPSGGIEGGYNVWKDDNLMSLSEFKKRGLNMDRLPTQTYPTPRTPKRGVIYRAGPPIGPGQKGWKGEPGAQPSSDSTKNKVYRTLSSNKVLNKRR